MYLCTKIVPVSQFRCDGRKTKYKVKKFSCLICDQCKNKYEIKYKTQWKVRDLHFCSKRCTDIARSCGGIVRKKVELTCQKKLGSSSPFSSELSKSKMRETWLKRYGVDSPTKSKIVQDKQKITMLSRYGVENPMQIPEIVLRAKKTCMKKYGVENPMQHPEFCRKARLSAMKNSTKSWSSHIENQFYVTLCNFFDSNDIQRQVKIQTWSIDFYVKSIDTYIQFDGVYWHGLNHDINDLMKCDTLQKQGIYKAWCQDKIQNEWFKQNNKNLIRITDQDFASSTFDLKTKIG